eukprot:EC721832.1.p1 GENE.EC721832.1~~EC721832.1.p1  ORF type:complete len:118 (+),score=13.35 EC721832.1:23-355(+)
MAWVNGSFAALLIFFGLHAYLKKRSLPSLLASSFFGLLFIYAAYTIYSGRPARGHQIALWAAAGLTVAMGIRFFKSWKFMPAGLVAMMGAAMVLRSLMAINELAAIKSRL